ncbi:hypothetical protein AA0535_2301 [Asaia krungthepensis NRIC 0535]|uniref:Transposase n=1 Tax=Asaia krungthepensis NRIC 0535 TaxID=1307925 RepID=A0ABQ0Q4S9_9PROT|nr:hypothetical protein AA0535_2301 [Asaia krungthepensis NRIC 0535]
MRRPEDKDLTRHAQGAVRHGTGMKSWDVGLGVAGPVRGGEYRQANQRKLETLRWITFENRRGVLHRYRSLAATFVAVGDNRPNDRA